MRERTLASISVVIAAYIHITYGCQIIDHTLWTIPIATSIEDVYGVGETVIRRATADIEGIINVSYGQATLGGPYFDLAIEGNYLVVKTNAAFPLYEEVEVASRVAITLEFRCTGGSSRGGLILWIDITDTNNNAPEFIPTNVFELVITPPLPPNFYITGCSNDVITVRDIDLTTYKIDFEIQDNPYFEIEYSEDDKSVPKEFVAHIRTKTFLRSMNETLLLTVTATDVDETAGPPQTATGMVRIVTTKDFQFPDQPVFEQPFYLANYTEEHELHLLGTISLRQGFDEYVSFSLEGEYEDNFGIELHDNIISLVVTTPLPSEAMPQKQIFLTLLAEREHTSGATTTIIVQLPKEISLQFERAFYDGEIKNNALVLAPLVLSEGYAGVIVTAEPFGEYSHYFTALVQTNLVTLTMRPLTSDVIDNNSFIPLQVVASSDRSSASTVVNLEIIKDDFNTPVFDQSIYTGSYDAATGLTMEQIHFVQGFDDTVTVNLTGEYANFFQIDEIDQVMTISSSTIPPEMFSRQHILITIEASKPRTVGARSTIYIALPEARELEFEESSYKGSIEGSLLSLETILLRQGYDEGVSFTLSGEYATYFNATNERESVTMSLSSPLPDIAITQSSVIFLTLTASGLNAVSTTTSVLLDVIKEDTSTPVFTRPIYYGMYTGGAIEIEAINLTQGFDSGVSFRIDGAHSQYFAVSNESENALITLQSPIPEDVIFTEKVLLFNILADKAFTVGASAAVLIRFPTEFTDSAIMRFSQNTYVGSLEENEFHLEDVVLDTGFAPGTEFILSGEYADYFSLSSTNNTVQISNSNTLPNEVLVENDFIVLEIEARRTRAVSVWTSVVVNIVRREVIAPAFGQAYYTGSYTEDTGLMFEETINLSEGFDETVTFALSGDPEAWFSIEQEGETLTLVPRTPVPTDVLDSNNQLLFTIVANKPNTTSARAVISLDLPKDFTNSSFRFQQDFYKGYLENGILILNEIILGDYTSEVNYTYAGDYADHFQLTNQNGTFIMQLDTSTPNEILEEINLFVFTLEVQNLFIRTHTVIIIENLTTDVECQQIEFEEPYYLGTYSTTENLQFDAIIRLASETNQSVTFDLEGDDAEWFSLVPNENSVTLRLTTPIPAAVIANNQQLVFAVTAQKLGSATARTTIVIGLIDWYPEGSPMLGFERINYHGSIENNQVNISAITLTEGFTQDVEFILHGELENYFSLSPQGAVVTIVLQSAIPEELIPANRIIVLEIQASAPQYIPAYATIILGYITDHDMRPVAELIFSQTFYNGSYATTTGLSFSTAITLTQGYDSDVEFALEGDDAEWFGLVLHGNLVSVTLSSLIPAAVIANNQQLVFVVAAQRPRSATARATIIVNLLDWYPEGSPMLGFDRITYHGIIENNQVNISGITLNEGFTQDVEFILHGELENFFILSPQGAVVTITLLSAIPEELIPTNRMIVLELQASAPQAVPAHATIVLEYVVDVDSSPVVELIFAQTFYNGSYTAATGLSFPIAITLTQGYASDVEFALEGDDAEWFGLLPNGNSVEVTLTSPIPATVIANNQQLVFVVTAQKPASATARSVVVIALSDDSLPEPDVRFDKVLYEGFVQNGTVSHEVITVSGFSGSTIELYGEYSGLFSATLLDDRVTVTSSGNLTLPSAATYVALELRAESASAALILNVVHSEGSHTPTVMFSSPSYAVRVDISHTGLVGSVHASADNGEAVSYSLLLDNAHLEERFSINSVGELYLSAPLNSGFYNFEVVATTVFTQIRGTATVYVSVEAVTVCDDVLVMPPLIVLDVDEEEPHYDLINGTRYENCYYSLTNRWPANQSWVYVDERGLHTVAIDREHESIAFMALSQVQVEVILHCESDSTRIKRSASNTLGPYDYGNSNWILTDTILFNSRRSLVNIIVNDINDNAPIFVGKENEPIVVGYPIPELAERVLPRSLVELKATDADIGENAALLYWSSAPQLAVAPSTGFVHLRDGAILENGAWFNISATDRNGTGLTGSISILVRLLNEDYIAVVTVRDAFLDDEENVIALLSESVGYEVKVLRSVVISDEVTESSRKKRDVTSAAGASLQLYIYGLVAREPVSVEQLMADINNIVTAPVTIASSVSLQDHLEGQEICVIARRDTGLLVSTIVLSVLLFIVLVLIAVWFFLRWRKNRNYDEFSDERSLASTNASEDRFPESEVSPKPRLDIAELKRSERRLQEMLDAPTEDDSIKQNGLINEATLKMPELMAPIVIQSIDKLKDAADDSSDDEFGEVKTPRRKSMVTFNENVEKIIHVEDSPDGDDLSEDPEFEVYKL